MAVVPSSHTFTSGVATSSEANAYIRDPVADSTITAVTFTAEDVDTDVTGTGGHDNVTNNTRYTAVYAGWYQVAGGINFTANGTGDRFAWWRVNGTDVNGSSGFLGADATNDNVVMPRTKLVFLNVGDYVELIGFQSSGAPLNTLVSGRAQSNMSVVWVSNA